MVYLLSGHSFRTVCPHLLALQWTLLLEGAGLLLSKFQGFVHGSDCDWSPIEPDWQTNWVAWI